MTPKSTRKNDRGKAAKPHPDFPLFPHAAGRWAKEIQQKLHYFGSTADDPKGQAGGPSDSARRSRSPVAR